MEIPNDVMINYFTPNSSMNLYPFKAFKISNRAFSQLPHTHSYLQIWYVKSGNCVHTLNGKEHELEKGDIFILPPDVPHSVASKDSKSTELLGCEFMEEFILGNGEKEGSLYYDYIKPFIVDKKDVKPFYSLTRIKHFQNLSDVFLVLNRK